MAFALFFYPFPGILFKTQRHPKFAADFVLGTGMLALGGRCKYRGLYVGELLSGYAEHDIAVRTVIG